jgi:monovalent cation/hydrogen antiporter
MKGLPLTQLLIHAGVVCGVVILTRFIWMYPATYLPRWLFPSIARRDPSPPWQWPFVLAFTGVRGIVSLAAALAIPLTTDAGAPFPNRDLVLFLAFAVVLVTLVAQGLTLPLVIRWLGLADTGGLERAREREQELQVRRQAIAAALKRLEAVCKQEGLAAEILTRFQNRLHDRLTQTEWRADPDPQMVSKVSVEDELELRLIGVERDLINDLYCGGDIKDEARRRIERELDLREAGVENLRREPTSE